MIGAGNAQASSDTKVVTVGTHRVRSFADTWAAVSPHLWDMGITRVGNVTGLDDVGIPVAMVARPNARTLAVSQGKGLTWEAARLSGVLEAAELFHAEEVELPVRRAPARAMLGGDAVDVHRLPLAGTPRVPVERPLRWVEGQDLLSGARRWVPEQCVALGQGDAEERVFAGTSSGLAAGNSWPEAVSHAVCEVVERHLMTIWHRLPALLQRATGIDLTSIEDEAGQALVGRCVEAGLAVGIWDMTGQVQLPAFACYLAQRSAEGARLVPPAAGYGCHPSREVALARAITEAAQSRLTVIAGARDDMTETQYTTGSDLAFTRRAVEFIDSAGGRRFDSVPSRDCGQVSADLEWELDRLQAATVTEAVAVDLSQGALGIPVVRVVIPGLCIPGFRSGAERTTVTA